MASLPSKDRNKLKSEKATIQLLKNFQKSAKCLEFHECLSSLSPLFSAFFFFSPRQEDNFPLATMLIFFKLAKDVLKSQMLKIFSKSFPVRKKKARLFLQSSSVLHVMHCYRHYCSLLQIKSCLERY